MPLDLRGNRVLLTVTVLLALLSVFWVLTGRSREEKNSQPGSSATLVGAGDIASCDSDGDEDTSKLLDGISGTVFTAGDNVYPNGAAPEFAHCYEPTWGRHKARTRPSPGNHDYLTKDATAYFDYFGANAGEKGKGYYSYNLGRWHIIALNSNCASIGGCGAGSPQGEWLAEDLARSKAECTLAYFHHPFFSSGTHGNQDFMKPLWQILYRAGTDVVVSGHDHTYERFATQDPEGRADSTKGIRQLVVGTGGRSLYDFKTVRPNSEVRDNSTFGVLKLTLKESSYDWEFVPAEGSTFRDSGTGTCH